MKIENTIGEYLSSHSSRRQDNYDFLNFLHKIKFELEIPFIHVTGTNGKGSVTQFLANIYKNNGYKVGSYESPYFLDCTETINVNGKHITNEEMNSIYLKYAKEITKAELTEFEVLTFIALYFFKQQKCDLVVLEVGMGGLHDATNIDEIPSLAIINNVGIEHSAELGRSRSEIAYNKAGIIKGGCPVLVNIVDEDCKFAIDEVAKKNKSKVYQVSEFYNYDIIDGKLHIGYYPYSDIVINNNAYYQRYNAACALEACSVLKDKFPVTQEGINKGFLENLLDGRFTELNIKGKRVIVDGAHNPDAAEVLVKSLDMIPSKRKVAIIGVFRDKNVEKFLAVLGSHVNKIYLTTFNHEIARTEEEFFLFTEEYQFINYMDEFEKLIEDPEEDIILVSGSLYFSTLFISELKNKGLINDK